jgi:hypothetical protein
VDAVSPRSREEAGVGGTSSRSEPSNDLELGGFPAAGQFALYALISRMRILSSPDVISEAEKVARLIVDRYPERNKTFSDVRAMVDKHALDPLRAFSEACREELRGS